MVTGFIQLNKDLPLGGGLIATRVYAFEKEDISEDGIKREYTFIVFTKEGEAKIVGNLDDSGRFEINQEYLAQFGKETKERYMKEVDGIELDRDEQGDFVEREKENKKQKGKIISKKQQEIEEQKKKEQEARENKKGTNGKEKIEKSKDLKGEKISKKIDIQVTDEIRAMFPPAALSKYGQDISLVKTETGRYLLMGYTAEKGYEKIANTKTSTYEYDKNSVKLDMDEDGKETLKQVRPEVVIETQYKDDYKKFAVIEDKSTGRTEVMKMDTLYDDGYKRGLTVLTDIYTYSEYTRPDEREKREATEKKKEYEMKNVEQTKKTGKVQEEQDKLYPRLEVLRAEAEIIMEKPKKTQDDMRRLLEIENEVKEIKEGLSIDTPEEESKTGADVTEAIEEETDSREERRSPFDPPDRRRY